MEQFESIKKLLPPDESPYRLAQELCRELKFEYIQFVTFMEKAISNCQNNGQDIAIHFVELETDYQLSPYACYLIVEKLPIEDTEHHKKLKNYFYAKDFEGWNIDKQKVHDGVYGSKAGTPRYINEREIRDTKRGINIGSETDGKGKYLRPVLVLKNMGTLCLVAPLTRQGKEGDHLAAHLYYKLESVSFYDKKIDAPFDSFVMLNQIKIIDKKRCIKNKKTIDPEEFKTIKKLLRDMYFPEAS